MSFFSYSGDLLTVQCLNLMDGLIGGVSLKFLGVDDLIGDVSLKFLGASLSKGEQSLSEWYQAAVPSKSSSS